MDRSSIPCRPSDSKNEEEEEEEDDDEEEEEACKLEGTQTTQKNVYQERELSDSLYRQGVIGKPVGYDERTKKILEEMEEEEKKVMIMC